jgi:hypothetical protein
VKATPEMVVVTPGGKPIMFYVILALIDPGDEVLYPNPGFPIYESMIRYIGGVPVPVRLLEEKAYALDVDRLDCSVDGRRARPTTVLADGNRVDLARPLEVDPKSIRRLRALARPLRPTVKPERRGRE